MKTIKKCTKFAFIFACTMVLLSCEKPGVSYEFNRQDNLEGNKSTTGNSDTVLEIKNLDISVPLLHAHFDETTSKEEARAAYDEMVATYMKSNERQNRGVSTEWFYRIMTNTGDQPNNDTDGTVIGVVNFSTDKGKVSHSTFLNKKGYDDREGGWDIYLIKTSIPGQAVSWVRADNGSLWLYGMDGWFVKNFEVTLHPRDQSAPASNGSAYIDEPNVWLDNDYPSGWDIYYAPENFEYYLYKLKF